MSYTELQFANKAYELLINVSDILPHKELCLHLISVIEDLAPYKNKHEALLKSSTETDRILDVLKGQLVLYKEKFEVLNEQMTKIEHDNVIIATNSVVVPEIESIPEDDFPVEIVAPKIRISNKLSECAIKDQIEIFSQKLNEKLGKLLVDPSLNDFLRNFYKYRNEVEDFACEVLKGKTFDKGKPFAPESKNLASRNSIFFTHLNAEQGNESTLSFTIRNINGKMINACTFSFIPQSMVRKILALPNCEEWQHTQVIIKNIKDTISPTIIKVGTRNYWLLPIALEINSIKKDLFEGE